MIIRDKWKYREAKDALDALYQAGLDDTEVYLDILRAVRRFEKRHVSNPACIYSPLKLV